MNAWLHCPLVLFMQYYMLKMLFGGKRWKTLKFKVYIYASVKYQCVCSKLCFYIFKECKRRKKKQGSFRKKRQKNDKKIIKCNCLNSPCFHALPHMCRGILKIIQNIYGHLYPHWIYTVFLVVIPFLLIQSSFLLRLPSCRQPCCHKHKQTNVAKILSSGHSCCWTTAVVAVVSRSSNAMGPSPSKLHPVIPGWVPTAWQSLSAAARLRGSGHQPCLHIRFRFQLQR